MVIFQNPLKNSKLKILIFLGKSGTSQVTSSTSSTTSPPTGPSGTTSSGAPVKENSPAGFQGGNSNSKPFRGNSARGSSTGGSGGGGSNRNAGGSSGSGQQASRDRYHPSRESVSSTAEENPGRGGGSRMGNNTLNNFPDSHQVFVGNLPHDCREDDLQELFSKFGKVSLKDPKNYERSE